MNNGAGGSGGGGFGGFSNGESGILRKTGGGGHHHHHHHGGGQDTFADLLVFGYSCKMFRDDEKARFIDSGRHLIPWSGDNQLKIDRYDARGALHDLSQHEPPIGGYGNRLDCLAPAEQRAEQLCEEERYYSLYANEVEEEIYQEEAAKRQALSGAEIAFDYDAPSADGATMVGPVPADSAGIGDDDENSLDPPFEAPKGFEIPTDLELPETMKEHAIIEKTAKFIASQDSQMEILLRAKQAANPQFGFLSPGGKLYRYYRHVLMAIKTNRYPEEVEEVPEKEAEAAPAAEEVEVLPKPKVIVPSIKYKPSVDCAYTQLISKITGAPIPPENQVTAAAPLTPTQLTSLNTEYEYSLEEKPVEVKKVSTGLAGLVQYNSDSDDSSSETDQKEEKKPEVPKPEQREIVFTGKLPPEIFQHVIEKTATYVAKNGYSFEDALRTKNDPRFLFLRKDHEFYPYFAFRVRYLINPYEDVPKSPEKVTITREIANGTVVETPSIGIKTVNVAAPVPAPAQQTQIQSTKPGGAVCFSIKSSKEDAPVALKSSVIQELGADEEEAEPAKEEKEKSRTPSRERDVEEKPAERKVVEKPAEKKVVEKCTEKKVAEKPAEKRVVDDKRSTTPPAVIDMSPSPVEEPKVSSAEDEIKEQKRQEERIKDKLTTAAREKLAAITKEKQLQLERKKRASMFLSMMGNKAEPKASKDDPEPVVAAPSPSSSSTSQDTPPQAPGKNGLDLLKDSTAAGKDQDKQSDASIHSIPSQSTTPEVLSSDDDDDVVLVGVSTQKDNGATRRSRSRTRSDSKHKKRKHKHHKSKSKKAKKKKSRSRSVSRSRSSKAVKRKRARSSSRSESSRRSRSRSRDGKKRKKDKKKSHKHHKSSRSSSRSKHHHSRREEQQREGEDFDWDAL
ncbi:protein suppressor of white apricot [Culex pipiens pallens]|uniref:protein suppressor of white apricot n=1 Tax=Culex pipiens pallens TaxID=42434 RepID=UPI001954A28E|nr:protein suppressor of white apricot [Culex pipiens pallens]